MEFVLRMAGESLSATLGDISRQYHKPFLVTSYNSFTHANFPERLLNRYHEAGEGLIFSGGLNSLSKTADHYFAVVENQRVVDVVNRLPDKGQPMMLIDTAICGQNMVDYLETLRPLQTPIFANPLMDVFRGYIRKERPAFMAETAWLLPVITDHDLLALNRHLLDEEQDTHILSELPASVRILPPVRIDPQVSVGQGATIGPYAYLESGCTVGERAAVHHAMVLQSAIVSAGEAVSDMIISSRTRLRA
jgi:NDP-sugar pyrophosphorylase family protein